MTSSELNDIKLAMARGDLDARDAAMLVANMADVAAYQLEVDSLLTTAEREEIEATIELADAALVEVQAEVWADDALGDLPLTTERD